MQHQQPIILAIAFAAAIAATGLAVAQSPATPATPTTIAQRDAGLRGGGALAPRTGRAGRLAGAVRNDPGMAVILNLRAIERVYRHDGRAKDLPAFYREQLARTQDPLVRNFVNYRLARLELREDDARGALEALNRNLEENYRRL